MSTIHSFRFKLRRDEAADWTAVNPVLLDGEPGYERDTNRLKLGDGVTAWNSLGYLDSDVVADLVAEGAARAAGDATLTAAVAERVVVTAEPVPIRFVTAQGTDTNDGKAWGSAFASLAAAYTDLPDNGKVEVAPGLIPVASTFEIVNTLAARNKRVTIEGAGEGRTILQRTGDFPLLRIKGVEGTLGGNELANDVTLKGMTLDGRGFEAGGPGYSSNLVELLEVNHVHAEGVRFYNVVGSGVYGRTVENSHFKWCRFSGLGTTTGSNRAGVEIINGSNLDTNGIRWYHCDFEVTSGGRDLHLLGDTTRKLGDIYMVDCKFESTPNEPFAPSQRVFFEYVDNAYLLAIKGIRGQNTILDFSLCGKVTLLGGNLINGRGPYLIHFRDGGPYFIDDYNLQGSSAWAGGTPNTAHIGIGATADVSLGTRIAHAVMQGEPQVQDLRGYGKRDIRLRDSLGHGFVYQKSGVTAGASVIMGSITGALVDYVVPRAGRIVGLSVLSGSTVTAGTATATVQKNAVDTALTAQVDTTATRSKTTQLAYESGLAVAAGDLVRVTIAASASFAPTAAVFNAHAYYVPDPVAA